MRYQSAAAIGDIPVVCIAFGPDLHSQQLRGRAVGVIAVGDVAVGIIAVGAIASRRDRDRWSEFRSDRGRRTRAGPGRTRRSRDWGRGRGRTGSRRPCSGRASRRGAPARRTGDQVAVKN